MSGKITHVPEEDVERLCQRLFQLFQEAIASAKANGNNMVRSVELHDGAFHWQVYVPGAGSTTVVWRIGKMSPEQLVGACDALEQALPREGE